MLAAHKAFRRLVRSGRSCIEDSTTRAFRYFWFFDQEGVLCGTAYPPTSAGPDRYPEFVGPPQLFGFQPDPFAEEKHREKGREIFGLRPDHSGFGRAPQAPVNPKRRAGGKG
jgi:hypothetical protein